MPDTVEIEDVATTKTAAQIDPDGDYAVLQSAAGDTFKALVEQVVRGVLEQLATQVTIGDDLLVEGNAFGVTGTDAKMTLGPGNLGVQSGVRLNISGGATGFHGIGLGTDLNNRLYIVWDAAQAFATMGQFQGGTNYANRIAFRNGNLGMCGENDPQAPVTIQGHIAISDGVTAPSAVGGYTQIYVDSADGDLKVIFGNGVVKTISVDT